MWAGSNGYLLNRGMSTSAACGIERKVKGMRYGRAASAARPG